MIAAETHEKILNAARGLGYKSNHVLPNGTVVTKVRIAMIMLYNELLEVADVYPTLRVHAKEDVLHRGCHNVINDYLNGTDINMDSSTFIVFVTLFAPGFAVRVLTLKLLPVLWVTILFLWSWKCTTISTRTRSWNPVIGILPTWTSPLQQHKKTVERLK